METAALLISCAKEKRAGGKKASLFQMSGIILFLVEEETSKGSSVLEFSLGEVTNYMLRNQSMDM